MSITILGIESSCDDTSAAIVRDCVLVSNVIASQKVHESYGGVVPELASRAHQQNIVPVVSEAIRQAGISKGEINAIAFTRGPGLLGSLLVGTSFAKGLSIALGIPIVDVNHLHGHVLSHFIKEDENSEVPEFPFLCLLVSGGNSQIIKVMSPYEMQVMGQTCLILVAHISTDWLLKVMHRVLSSASLIYQGLITVSADLRHRFCTRCAMRLPKIPIS